jgi:FMN reductase
MGSELRVVLVYGTNSPPGRLWAALEFTKGVLLQRCAVSVIDLSSKDSAHSTGALHDQSFAAATDGGIESLRAANACVVFSPVYRASAPGALKTLFDLAPLDALESKPVAIVSMGATAHHYLAVQASLSTVLCWFGAIAVPPGIYLTSASFRSGGLIDSAQRELEEFANTTADLAQRLSGFQARPRPLAAASA